MARLYAHAQYIFIACAKYQKVSVKLLVQIDFPVYALSKHKQTPNLKANRDKSVILLHATVQCVYIAQEKYQIVSAKAVV